MTFLSFNAQIRSETDQAVIDTLLRKGWVEAPQPSHDPATQYCDWVNGQWVVQDRDLASEQFNAAIAAGYAVDPEGFTIALGPEDRAQFAQLLALVREAIDLGLITGSTPQSIKAKDGTLHSLTTDRLRQILVGYGFHYKQLWDALNS